MLHSELIYLYIEDIGYCFKKQEFLFSQNYEVNYDKDGTRVLNIRRKENCLENIYGENIANINLLVGKNGSGKSTVMDLLALPRLQSTRRFKLHKGITEPTEGWFAIYSLDLHDNGRVTYYIEGYNSELISNWRSNELGNKNFAYSISIKDEKLVSISRKNVSDRIKTYYCPSRGYFEMSGKESVGGIAKKLVKPADAGEFFEFICYKMRRFKRDFSALNVEFVIKISNFMQQEMSEQFYTYKEQFLLKIFKIDLMDLDDEVNSNEVFERLMQIYFQELERGNKDFAEKLQWYVEENRIFSERFKMLSPVYKEKFTYIHFKKLAEWRAKRLVKFCMIPDKYFRNDMEIVLPAREEEMFVGEKQILRHFSEYQKEEWNQFGKKMDMDAPFIKCEYRNISQGEEALFRLFSSIAKELEKEKIDNTNVNITRIIFFDEPDISMHPEWGRRFLYDMTRLLGEIRNSERVKYQLVVATHSPFMVSDVLREGILRLNPEGYEETKVVQSKYGMLSNIHDILNDSFYLDAPFGELGKAIFDNIIRQIDEMEFYSEAKWAFIEKAVSEIGDELIRRQLERMIETKKMQQLQSDSQLRKKRIQQLEEELRVLKGSEA